MFFYLDKTKRVESVSDDTPAMYESNSKDLRLLKNISAKVQVSIFRHNEWVTGHIPNPPRRLRLTVELLLDADSLPTNDSDVIEAVKQTLEQAVLCTDIRAVSLDRVGYHYCARCESARFESDGNRAHP